MSSTEQEKNVPEEVLASITLGIRKELDRRMREGLDTILMFPITGGEGCGKTTLIKKLTQVLQNEGIWVETVKMLGGSKHGDAVRGTALNDVMADADPSILVPLMQAGMAAAAQKAAELVRTAGTTPLVIFIDRSPFDTPVYQVYGESGLQGGYEGIDVDAQAREIAKHNLSIFAKAGVPVGPTFYVDLDPAIGLARKYGQGGDEVNFMEERGQTFHSKVREGFQHLAHYDFRDQIVTVDGTETREEMLLSVLLSIREYLEKNQERVIIGKTADMQAAQYWAKSHVAPDDHRRALRILSTRIIDRMGQEWKGNDGLTYIEILRTMMFYLRDGQFPSNESRLRQANEVRWGLLANPIFRWMATFSDYRRSNTFISKLASRTPADIAENGWRDVTFGLQDQYERYINYVETVDLEALPFPYWDDRDGDDKDASFSPTTISKDEALMMALGLMTPTT